MKPTCGSLRPAVEGESTSSNAIVEQRIRGFIWLFALMTPLAISLTALGHSTVLRSAWEIGVILILLGVAFSVRSGRRVAEALAVAVTISVGPLTAPHPLPSAIQLSMVMAPLIVGLLFFDRVHIVLAATIPGLAANIGVWISNGTPGPDLARMAVTQIVGTLVLLFVTFRVEALRYMEIEAEQRRGQILRISETRRAHSERLAVVGRLASGVAHEINNPLAFVKANIGVLRRELFGPNALGEVETKEILSEVAEGVERIQQIVSDLKAFAREGSETVEAIELKNVMEGAVRLASVQLPAGLRTEVNVPRGLFVLVNPRKLAQVLLNVLINAGEAMEQGRTKKPSLTVSAHTTREGAQITISDNGPGLSDNAVDHLFEPFFTTKGSRGTGLGLALSREYLSSFGGTIRGTNAVAGGATFTLTLPIAPVTGEHPIPVEQLKKASAIHPAALTPPPPPPRPEQPKH